MLPMGGHSGQRARKRPAGCWFMGTSQRQGGLMKGAVRHQTPAGIFANAPFLRHLKKLGVRVVLYERSNGLAESISQGNTMRADNSNGTQQLRKVHLQLQKLSKVRQQQRTYERQILTSQVDSSWNPRALP
jgi:hypothetical protein